MWYVTPTHDTSDEATREFAADLRGSVVLPDDPEYDEARTVRNGMIDRYPAVIVRCAGVADVTAAVEFARGNGLPLAVRGVHESEALVSQSERFAF